MLNRIHRHPMIESLRSLKGNTLSCVLTEPLFGIPHSLIVPFASVYMLALGATDRQIGLVASLTLLTRAIAAIFSGVITDKLGRRRTLFFFDMLNWSLPCILWTFAQNIHWFYVAALINGVWQLTDNAWTCLLVEDADKHSIMHVYSWIYVSGQLAVFFVPLAGLLVGGLGIIPAARILYAIAFVIMTTKFVLLYKFSTETSVGKIRLMETRGKSLFSILSEYKSLIPRFFQSKEMRLATIVSVLFIAVNTVMDSFFGIYTTQTLGIPESSLAFFPILRSIVMLGFLFFVQPRTLRFSYRTPMLIGVFLYIASHITLILPTVLGTVATGSLLVPTFYTLLQACAHGLVMPRKDSLVALSLDKDERARMTSIMTVMMLAITIPFGYLAGVLSEINRSLPFAMNLALFAIAIIVVLKAKRLRERVDAR